MAGSGDRISKQIVRVRARVPAYSACEVPILVVVSRMPENGVRALSVVREVASSAWFPQLTDEDRNARYPASRKKIVSTVIRWARENLVLKRELYPPGEEGAEAGTWRATTKGLARATGQCSDWTAKYNFRDALITISYAAE